MALLTSSEDRHTTSWGISLHISGGMIGLALAFMTHFLKRGFKQRMSLKHFNQKNYMSQGIEAASTYKDGNGYRFGWRSS